MSNCRNGASLFITSLIWIIASTQLHAGDPPKPVISPEADKALDRMVERIKQLKSYADEGIVETKNPMGFGNETKPAAFIYEKPDRFRIAAPSYEICSDGKELTVFSRNMKRYLVSTLGKDWEKKVDGYHVATMPSIHVSELFFDKDPKEAITRMVASLELAGEETVGGERCIMLKGTGRIGDDPDENANPGMEVTTEYNIYLRKTDGLLRRVEHIQRMKFSKPEPAEDETEEGNPLSGMFSGFFGNDGFTTTHTYDLLNIHTDERPKEEAFAFAPPKGVTKVDRFYDEWNRQGSQASQFDLSGLPAPEFELPTLDGREVALADLHDKVTVLFFTHSTVGEGENSLVKKLKKMQEIEGEFKSEVSFLVLLSANPDEEERKAIQKADTGIDVVVDGDQAVQFAYFEDDSTHAKVLVDKKGVVQGRYSASMDDEATAALRADLQRLVNGETLPSGQPMSEEQIAEMNAQRMLRYSENAEEPINESHLKLAWTVRAREDQRMSMPMRDRQMPATRMWITDKDLVRLIGPDGESQAEFKLPEKSSDKLSFAQDDFVIGRFGNDFGLIHVKDLAPINFTSFGAGMKKREKGFEMKLITQSGKEAWTLELPPTEFQGPADLQSADLNGDRVDEVVFTHADSLWLVNGRGEVVVRKPCRNFGGWVRALDMDKDGKSELYLLCDGRLQRFDFQPR